MSVWDRLLSTVESEALVVLREFAVVLSVVGWCELWFCVLLVDSGLLVVIVLLSCAFVVSVPSVVVVVVRFAPLLVSTDGVVVWLVPLLVSAVVVVELSLFGSSVVVVSVELLVVAMVVALAEVVVAFAEVVVALAESFPDRLTLWSALALASLAI